MVNNKNGVNNNMNPILTVICLTYNHELYIERCLNSILSQLVDFKIELIVHNDASTDETLNIVNTFREGYPEIITVVNQEINQYSRFGLKNIMLDLLGMSRGDFVAFCEGDDYWTDSNKLSKQVEMLQLNPSLALVSGGVTTIDDNGIVHPFQLDNSLCLGKRFTMEEGVLTHWMVQTLTVVVRKADIPLNKLNEYKDFFDTMLFYEIMKEKSGYFFNIDFGVYFSHRDGIWNGKSERQQVAFSLKQFVDIWELNKEDNRIKSKVMELILKLRREFVTTYKERYALFLLDYKLNKKLSSFRLYI
jgi:glycosyltransferase involved in cell wall biosynthesis